MENLFGRPVPRLGFGCMRLPESQDGNYIEDEIQAMFDFAMTHGINYFDSAWHYIGSQEMIGKCLANYPRESYILVGKLCFHDGTLCSREEAEQAFQKELTDARTDYMDLELIHANDVSMLRRAAKFIESQGPVGCTACHYCVDAGCPAKIDIPKILSCLNMVSQYHNLRTARLAYYQAAKMGNHDPKDCLKCGKCERECPQKLPIRELLEQADRELDVGDDIDVWANHEE